MRQVRQARHAGYTLIEVMVAVLMLAIFSPMVAEICRMNGRSISDVNNRAAIVRETGFLTSTLAGDFGRAASLSVTEDGTLHLQVYASMFTNTQNEIVYACDTNSCLWRQETGSGLREMVATCVNAFDVTQLDDYTVRLDVLIRRGGNQRNLRFIGGVP